MNCIHNPFHIATTVTVEPTMQGTRLTCTTCESTADFSGLPTDRITVSGEAILDDHEWSPPGREPEDSPQLRMAEFEQVSAPPTHWRCTRLIEHPIGELCVCDPR